MGDVTGLDVMSPKVDFLFLSIATCDTKEEVGLIRSLTCYC